MYRLTITGDSKYAPSNQVFTHVIAEDRIPDVVKIVMEPQEGGTPEEQLFAEKRISQRFFNKLVKARVASRKNTEEPPCQAHEEG